DSELKRAAVLAAQVAMAWENDLLYRRLEQLAITDELTGLYSRRFLMETLRQQISGLARAHIRALSCLIIDVDGFKQINDTFGHLEGDRALVEVARTLGGGLRASDVLARLGGDEFIVLLPSTSLDGAIGLAEKLRAAVAAGGRITITIGVAEIAAP